MLSALAGFAVNLSSISAQAFILNLHHPKYSFYITVVVAVLFSIYQVKFRLTKLKFAHFSTMVHLMLTGSLLCLALFANSQGIEQNIWFAPIWLFLAFLASDFFRWSLNELTIRHLDPASSSVHLSYVMMAYEGGSLLVALMTYWHLKGNDPKVIIYLSCGVQLLVAAAYAFHFGSLKNLEVRFARKPQKLPESLLPAYSAVIVPFLTLALFAGMIKSSEDYIIRLSAVTFDNSFSGIQEVLAKVYSLRGLTILLVSPLIGKFIELKRPSLFYLIIGYVGSCLALVSVCLANLGLPTIVLFSSVLRGLERSVFAPSMYLFTGTFVPPVRGMLRSLQHGVYFAVGSLLLALWVSIVGPMLEDHLEIKVLFELVFAYGAIAIGAVLWLRKTSENHLFNLATSDHKPSAILAVHTLSFLKPKTFLLRMVALLKGNPKKTLRKTIIEGLGYFPESEVVPVILNEFKTENENIQLTVLNALRASGDYPSIQFILNTALTKWKTQTPLVRISALRLITEYYGRRAIPLLLNGLEENDDRIIANSLEQLATFKDKKLIKYFQKYSGSTSNRTATVALIGLRPFKETVHLYQKGIEALLTSGDPTKIASALYAVGYCQDPYFLPHMDSLLSSVHAQHLSVKATLAWALSSIKDERGYHLFLSYFTKAMPAEEYPRALHFFSQLPRGIRFDIIRLMFSVEEYRNIDRGQFVLLLKNARQDFHEEIDYIQAIIATLEEVA